MISNELIFGLPRDWGGFGEWGYFSGGLRKWVYAESSLYIFLLAVPLGGGTFTLLNASYFFCYDQGVGDELSAVLGVYFYYGQVHIREWPLLDIRRPDLKDQRPIERWYGWQPANVTSHIFPFGHEHLGSITRCIYPDQIASEIKLAFEPDHIGLSTSSSIIDQWGDMAATAWSLQYVPQSEVSEEAMQVAYDSALKGGWDG